MDCYHTLFLIPGLPFVEYPSRQTSHGGTAPERPREELCFLEGLCWLAATAASTSRAASASSKPSSSVNTPASASRPTMHVVHYFLLLPSVRSSALEDMRFHLAWHRQSHQHLRILPHLPQLLRRMRHTLSTHLCVSDSCQMR